MLNVCNIKCKFLQNGATSYIQYTLNNVSTWKNYFNEIKILFQGEEGED